VGDVMVQRKHVDCSGLRDRHQRIRRQLNAAKLGGPPIELQMPARMRGLAIIAPCRPVVLWACGAVGEVALAGTHPHPGSCCSVGYWLQG
jgi:hypothetical protein